MVLAREVVAAGADVGVAGGMVGGADGGLPARAAPAVQVGGAGLWVCRSSRVQGGQVQLRCPCSCASMTATVSSAPAPYSHLPEGAQACVQGFSLPKKTSLLFIPKTPNHYSPQERKRVFK